jgi:hypothetical protein
MRAPLVYRAVKAAAKAGRCPHPPIEPWPIRPPAQLR